MPLHVSVIFMISLKKTYTVKLFFVEAVKLSNSYQIY